MRKFSIQVDPRGKYFIEIKVRKFAIGRNYEDYFTFGHIAFDTKQFQN